MHFSLSHPINKTMYFGSLVYLSVINRWPMLFVFIELFINSETALYLTPLLIH